MKNYMQNLKERAISAYPPKSSRRWGICIAAALCFAVSVLLTFYIMSSNNL